MVLKLTRRRMTVPDARFGWMGAVYAARAFQDLGAEVAQRPMPRGERGSRAVLWEDVRRRHGCDVRPVQQVANESAAAAVANALRYLFATGTLEPGTIHEESPAAAAGDGRLPDPWDLPSPRRPLVEPSFLHAMARVHVSPEGGWGEEGNLVLWCALAAVRYGWLTALEAGGWRTQAARVIEWGRPPGPPAERILRAARRVKPGGVVRVRSLADLRSALAGGWPVVSGSNVGFRMLPRIEQDRPWGVREGRWPHALCWIGYDDQPARPGYYAINSWGEEAHGPAHREEPAGGFWIDAKFAAEILAAGDSYTWSAAKSS